MGEDRSQAFQGPCSLYQPSHVKEEEDQRVVMGGYDGCDTKASTTSSSSSTTSFSSEDLSGGSSRSSSLDTTDDASSSACSSSDGSLYDLSQLMTQLPIKRGLSKYYQGKSESFTSLSSVRSLEDLAKKESPYRKRMKACKSYGGGLDIYKSFTLPKPIISKRSSKGCWHSSSSFPRRRASFGSDCRPPLFPAQDYNLRC
ncbi:hypothetical protein RJ639_003526 [Escallonia herrerae]|uniref:Oxidative stress 3 n=1 Tax=Escallonia herrerae TaxID=1293975 RepID=A0AA89AVY8_9ASTE|nr:hypothetical protein RJ639_003526 [Escallonia herrerae]